MREVNQEVKNLNQVIQETEDSENAGEEIIKETVREKCPAFE